MSRPAGVSNDDGSLSHRLLDSQRHGILLANDRRGRTAQDTVPLKGGNITTDRASGSLPGKKTQAPPTAEDVTPAHRKVSRWERFRDAVSPFRPKRTPESTLSKDKRRSLLGEKVKYAPGEGAEFTEFSPMESDSSVSPTRHEATQEARRPSFLHFRSERCRGCPGTSRQCG